VPHLHPDGVAAARERPLLHARLPARGLHARGSRLGGEQLDAHAPPPALPAARARAGGSGEPLRALEPGRVMTHVDQPTDASRDDRRVAIVNEHMRLENAYDFDGCVAVFGRPRYEVVTDGELFDGADGVKDFLSQNHTAFPDFVFTPTRCTPARDACLVERRCE